MEGVTIEPQFPAAEATKIEGETSAKSVIVVAHM